MKIWIRFLALSIVVAVVHSAQAGMSLTGMSAFDTTATGNGGGSNLWDTTPSPNSRYNLYLTSPNSGIDGAFVNSGNGSSLPPNVTLTAGNYDFYVFASPGAVRDYFGLNLFFDGFTNPGISVFAAKNESSSGPYPGFSANSATSTYGLNNNVLPGSGSLTFSNGTHSATLTAFSWSVPSAYGKDRVSPYSTSPDGLQDFVGHFNLNVNPVPEPSSVFVFSLAVAAAPFVRRRKS